MKINFNARQIKLFDVTREMAEKKLAKFEKFFPESAELSATFSKEKNLEKVEITIHSDGMVFRAEDAKDTYANAVDSAIDSLERQIRKNKTRLLNRVKGEGLKIAEDDFPDVEEEFMFNVRTKTFPFKPMSIEEAILQMDMLGHSFFVFKDAQTLETCVVYKRKENGYGLIVPEE